MLATPGSIINWNPIAASKKSTIRAPGSTMGVRYKLAYLPGTTQGHDILKRLKVAYIVHGTRVHRRNMHDVDFNSPPNERAKLSRSELFHEVQCSA